MAYCDRCDRYFPHMRALDNHERDSPQHNICHTCGQDFSTYEGLKEHYVQSPRHHYCQHCNFHFDTDELYLDHLDESHWACLRHRRVRSLQLMVNEMQFKGLILFSAQIFANEYGLNEHYRQHSDHVYCELCRNYCPETGDIWAHAQVHHHTCPQCNSVCSICFPIQTVPTHVFLFSFPSRKPVSRRISRRIISTVPSATGVSRRRRICRPI